MLLPGGIGVDDACANPEVMDWLRTTAQTARRVVSVCTGAFLAADAGLLDGCRATTHWAFARRMQEQFPAVGVDPRADLRPKLRQGVDRRRRGRRHRPRAVARRRRPRHRGGTDGRALDGALLVSGVAQVFAGLALDVSGGSRVLLFISGALSIVLGIFAFREFSHGAAVWLLGIWIGVGFIFQGVTESALAISYRDFPERGWHIFLGILTALAGVVVLTWPFDSIVLLAIVAGAWLVAIGITQIVWAFRGGGRRPPSSVASRGCRATGFPDQRRLGAMRRGKRFAAR